LRDSFEQPGAAENQETTFPTEKPTGETDQGNLQEGGSSQKKEQQMRLNETQVKQTLSQMNAQVLPDNHPVTSQLADMFGDHTFFLDQNGLKVLEPAETAETEVPSGEVVSLADWSDATLTSLTPHAPETTGTIIEFDQVRH
jgi:hypothetical protein